MKPRKYADLIKAWADGAEIQFRAIPGIGDWKDEPSHLIWEDYAEYRIKPVPKPDRIGWMYICKHGEDMSTIGFDEGRYANLMLIFDGETGALKFAEVLK